jgi:hypothetical protein
MSVFRHHTDPTHRRRLLLVIITASAIALVPWIIDLAVSLPHRYVANHWKLAWVGFDLILLAFLGATAWLGWHRRQLVLLTSFTTGVLLCCDAWLDVLTARRGDLPLSLLSACIEIPLAVLLFRASWRLLRMTVSFYGEATHQSDVSVWTMSLPG